MKELLKSVDIPDTDDLYKYSNPIKAQEKSTELLGEYGTLYKSSRKKKKYMIYDPYNNKFIHFGLLGYEDYLKHNNDLRRSLFLQRNKRWSNSNIFTPAWLSYYILW